MREQVRNFYDMSIDSDAQEVIAFLAEQAEIMEGDLRESERLATLEEFFQMGERSNFAELHAAAEGLAILRVFWDALGLQLRR